MGVGINGGAVWQLYRGVELIGEIRDAEFYDMFWTRGEFHACGNFERDYRALFDDFIREGANVEHARRAEVLATIRESMHLIDPKGTQVSIFSLVIEGDRARFRRLRAERL